MRAINLLDTQLDPKEQIAPKDDKQLIAELRAALSWAMAEHPCPNAAFEAFLQIKFERDKVTQHPFGIHHHRFSHLIKDSNTG